MKRLDFKIARGISDQVKQNKVPRNTVKAKVAKNSFNRMKKFKAMSKRANRGGLMGQFRQTGGSRIGRMLRK